MKRSANGVVRCLISVLLLFSLLLVPAQPALAKTHFFLGLNVGVPLGPYPVYAYPYAAPVYVYYPPTPVYRVYPPCVRVWVPGYYDAYGNWVFVYYRYQC